jgi:Uma2 family endonuclease
MRVNSPITDSPIFTTVEEFLAWAGAQPDSRYELVDGEPVMMVGGSRSHARISGNLSAWLLEQLRGGPCEPFGSDFGVVLPGGRVNLRYPDASVSCTEEGEDALRSPVLLAEVLSPSTEAYDRGAKAQAYRRLPSLRHLLLIEQGRPFIEHLHRASEGVDWTLTEVDGLDATIDLAAIGLVMPMAALYARLEFNPGPAADLSA